MGRMNRERAGGVWGKGGEERVMVKKREGNYGKHDDNDAEGAAGVDGDVGKG